MNRAELDGAMRVVLINLATCSHVPAAGYQPTGRSPASDEPLGGKRPPGDLGATVYARLYGPPFFDPRQQSIDHETREVAKTLGIFAPADSDEDRRRVLKAARTELEHVRGQADVDRPLGESVAERNKRLVDEGEGLTAAEAAYRFRLEGGEREARRIRIDAARYPEDGKPAAKDLTTDQKRQRAREMRARNVPTRDVAEALGVHQTQVMRWTRDMTTRRAA